MTDDALARAKLAKIPPNPKQDGWKNVPIIATGSDDPLVPIGPFSDYPTLFTNSVYFGERSDSPYRLEEGNVLNGALITVFVRKGVADRLVKAQELLPEGHQLVVYDAYRPLEVQEALYDHYLGSLRRERPDLTEAELTAETQKYVSLPSHDPTRPSPHNTGGSVDLGIVRLSSEDGTRIRRIDQQLAELQYDTDWSLFANQEPAPYAEPNQAGKQAYVLEMERMLIMRDGCQSLNFGTPFDHGGPEAALRHYEDRPVTEADLVSRDNRRLLYHAMIDVGFAPYPDEYWHYNHDNQMAAQVLGLPWAEYDGQELGPAHREFEKMRLDHHAGMIVQFEREFRGEPNVPAGYRSDLGWAHDLNHQALKKMLNRGEGVHPVRTGLPRAAVIEAPTSTRRPPVRGNRRHRR